MNATPSKWDHSRRERIEMRGGKDAPELELPPAPGAEYIAGYLFEAGPTSGEHSLSWSDLDAWSRRTGVEPSEFEATTIIALSREYMGMLRKAQDPNCPRPVRLTPEQKIAMSLRQAAAARARHQKD